MFCCLQISIHGMSLGCKNVGASLEARLANAPENGRFVPSRKSAVRNYLPEEDQLRQEDATGAAAKL